MKKYSILACAVAILLAAGNQSRAALTTVNFDSGGYQIFNTDALTPVTSGSQVSPIDGDGAVLQLGYFSTATAAAPFSGSWIALTGEGGLNPAYSIPGSLRTTVGDVIGLGANTPPGQFALSLDFGPQITGGNVLLPTAGTPLGIRIYNATTIALSTALTTISSTKANWRWLTPADAPANPIINISLADTPLNEIFVYNGTNTGAVADGTFYTNTPVIAVPEPSTFLFGIMVALTGATIRRRR